MFIKDLQARQTNVDVEGSVIEMGDIREFSKFGRQGKVANAIIKDSTGQVKLSLWNEQIEKVKVGDTVKVTKGYVGEFQGELQLTTGKFGTMEVTGGTGEAAAPAPAPKPEPAAEQEIPSSEIEDDSDFDDDDDSIDVEEEEFK